MIKKRVAIIGAGPCGLSTIVAFQAAKKQYPDSYDFPDVVCFEKQSDLGGLWQYTDWTGIDESGEPVHSSMYRYLFSNGPKECLEHADYTFDEHFKKPIGSYPPRAVLLDYIQGRAEKAGVRQFIRFQTVVRNVQFNDSSDPDHPSQFEVTVHDIAKDHTYTEFFDFVIVASGHFSFPNLVTFPGQSTFTGRLLHAHDFRDANQFAGQNILVVGTSYSAEDIGSQCWKYGAKSITVSYRTKPMGYEWPTNKGKWQEKPLIDKIDGSTVHFKDGSKLSNVDAIILCVGYRHYFPFLTDDTLRLKTTNRLWPTGLYKGVVWESNPQLFYLGMQDQFYTFNMFDVQAWYVRDVILGRLKLPDSLTEMKEDSAEWSRREGELKNDHDFIWFQGDYVKDLMKLTDYPDFDVDGVNRTFEEWEHHKVESIMGYRNNAYASLMTGTMGTLPSKPWQEEMDDSMEAFLAASN